MPKGCHFMNPGIIAGDGAMYYVLKILKNRIDITRVPTQQIPLLGRDSLQYGL